MVVLHVTDLVAALFATLELQRPWKVITAGSDADADEDVFECVEGVVELGGAFIVELAGFVVWAKATEHINKHTEARYNIQKNASTM